MFFLLRVAFWLSIVLVLLPSGAKTPQAGPGVDPVEAVSAAGATISDMSRFCDRQPDACEVGSQAAVAFGHRAQAGAKIVYDYFFNDKNSDGQTGSIKTVPVKAMSGAPVRPSQHTLRPADLQPAWRGPTPHKDSNG
jgi:hypothetical protein